MPSYNQKYDKYQKTINVHMNCAQYPKFSEATRNILNLSPSWTAILFSCALASVVISHMTCENKWPMTSKGAILGLSTTSFTCDMFIYLNFFCLAFNNYYPLLWKSCLKIFCLTGRKQIILLWDCMRVSNGKMIIFSFLGELLISLMC